MILLDRLYGLIFLFCIVWSATLHAQINDDFSDGNFTANPVWLGDTSFFNVNAGNQLQLNAPSSSDTAHLQTKSSTIDSTEWQCYVKLDFNPSSNNFARIYLVADTMTLEDSVNGYYIRIGGTADDISLYRTGSGVPIIDGPDNMVDKDPVTVRLRVRRDNSGNWTLWADTLGGSNFQLIGSNSDNTFNTTTHFGFYCQYTSTRSDKFFFDDVYAGPYLIDATPPKINQLQVVSDTELDVYFNEGVDKTSAEQTDHYAVNQGIGSPMTAVRDGSDQTLVHLTFPNNFINETLYTLTVDSVVDFSGNPLINGQDSFTYYRPKQNDIIISEILADPNPTVQLPEEEFVELHNRSNYPIEINNWTFSDPSTTAQLPPFQLPPDSFVILCPSSAASQFSSYGQVIGLSNWPSLNNGRDELVLKDNQGRTIYGIVYSDDWYRIGFKSDGGWSLEMQDVQNPCGGAQNWRGAEDSRGGTPGTINSIASDNPDTIDPRLVHAYPVNATTLRLYFSEQLDSTIVADPTYYKINEGIGNPIKVEPIAPLFKTVELTLSTPLQKEKLYEVSIDQVADCIGNTMKKDTARFGLPEKLDSFDIVINEVLFNPIPNGVDFVEIYNRSDKILDLKDLMIANAAIGSQMPEDNIPVHSSGRLILPNEYFALTTDIQNIDTTYQPPSAEQLLMMEDLPTYPNKEGQVVLTDQLLHVIDWFTYHEDMHFDLLEDNEGVSLERINFDRKTQSENNWHSAASTARYGTPGTINSQFDGSKGGDNTVTISPEVFSPDDDGYKDFVNIHYHFEKGGYVAQVIIYDAKGRLIKQIANNALLEKEGTFTWDGTNENGEKARMGIYLIYFETFNKEGKVLKFKKSCVVGGQL